MKIYRISALGLMSALFLCATQVRSECPQEWIKTICECKPSDNRYCPYEDIEPDWTGVIPCGLCPGRKIYIQGTVTDNSAGFTFDFYGKNAKGKGIPLHYNNRISKGVTVLNNRAFGATGDGGWHAEQRIKCPFKPGMDFETTIEITKDGFSISIDNDHFGDFKRSYAGASHIGVYGGVSIAQICFN